MSDFIDITQFSAGVSCIGIFLILSAFRVRMSKSWEESSRIKKGMLIGFGFLCQIPVAVVIISRPAVVSDTLSVEEWTWKNLLINYLAIAALCIVVFIISPFFNSYDASK